MKMSENSRNPWFHSLIVTYALCNGTIICTLVKCSCLVDRLIWKYVLPSVVKNGSTCVLPYVVGRIDNGKDFWCSVSSVFGNGEKSNVITMDVKCKY
jgi:hypothetical protein